MTFDAHMRKLLFAVHVVSSVGWLGAVLAYLAVAVAAAIAEEAQTVRAAWIAMELIGWTAVVPLALVSLLSGIVQGLATPWGLFRHYWVLLKLLLTAFATVILLKHMPDVSAITAAVAQVESADLLSGGGRSDLLHAVGAVVVLLATAVLAIYKPSGLTRYGWRKRHEARGRP